MIELRLANTMGLDINNAQHSVAITEALYGIEDVNSFLEFCVDKKNGIDYETKTEKLMTLSTMYKKLQERSKLPHDTAKSFSKQLSYKVEQTRNIVEDKNIAFSMISVDGIKFFTEKELKALQGIGSIVYIIESSRNHTLEEQLMDLFLGKFIAKSKYEALTNNQQRMKKLVQGVKT